VFRFVHPSNKRQSLTHKWYVHIQKLKNNKNPHFIKPDFNVYQQKKIPTDGCCQHEAEYTQGKIKYDIDTTTSLITAVFDGFLCKNCKDMTMAWSTCARDKSNTNGFIQMGRLFSQTIDPSFTTGMDKVEMVNISLTVYFLSCKGWTGGETPDGHWEQVGPKRASSEGGPKAEGGKWIRPDEPNRP